METLKKVLRAAIVAGVAAVLAAVISAPLALTYSIVGGALIGLAVGSVANAESRFYTVAALCVIWIIVPLIGGLGSYLFIGSTALLAVALGLALGGIPAYFLSR